MKIVMLTTLPGSVDGIRVGKYEAGQEYDLTATVGARELATAFVDAGVADEVGAKRTPKPDVAAGDGEDADAPTPAEADASAPAKPGRRAKAQ